MNISVLDPVTPAIDRTKLVLFQPFDVAKWFKLGFCAFLASLGSGGGGSNFAGNTGNVGNVGDGGGGPDLEPVWRWLGENFTLIVGIVAAVVVALMLIYLIITWLNSRGNFMFIDGIVHNRAAVVAPWNEFRTEANSLFWFRVAFCVFCLVIPGLLIGGCVLIALPGIQAKEFTASAVLALALGIPTLICFAIAAGLVSMFLTQMVVPIMYLRRVRVMEGWSIFRHEILAGRIGTFILYILFQIVIGFAVGILALIGTCATCCLTIVPYVGTVILLPLFVFQRSYQLCFLEQFGPDWAFFWGKPASPSSPFTSPPPESK